MDVRHKISDYFSKQGINVIPEALNSSEYLRRSYTNNFDKLVQSLGFEDSNYAKINCYQTLFPIQPRPKFTGFEHWNILDKKLRAKLNRILTSEPKISDHIPINDTFLKGSNYLDNLKISLSILDNPLLYLSGGIDSELVALTLLSINKNFTPVIFKFIDNLGEWRNYEENKWALEFCNKNHLLPIIRVINIDELWNSQAFIDFAQEVGITSPQIATHAMMIKLISDEYKDRTHVMGGEVRFKTDYKAFDEPLGINLVYQTKVSYSIVVWDNDPYSPYSLCACDLYTSAVGYAAVCTYDPSANLEGQWFFPPRSSTSYYCDISASWIVAPVTGSGFFIANDQNMAVGSSFKICMGSRAANQPSGSSRVVGSITYTGNADGISMTAYYDIGGVQG